MSYIKSLNELEYFAGLIPPALEECTIDEVIEFIGKYAPIEIAYKVAVLLQGAIHFPKKDDAVYENIGQVNVQPVAVVASNIGRVLLDSEDRPEFDKVEDEEKYSETRNLIAFHLGYWLISILINDDKLRLEKGQFEKDAYKIVAKDGEFMDSLFFLVNTNPLDIQVRTRPSYVEPKPFTKLHHKIGGDMVRAINPKARSWFTYDNCPEVFDAINKQMTTPYRVDMELLSVYRQIQDDPLFTKEDKLLSEEQKAGIFREMKNVLDVAEGTKGRKFWEYAFYDYRGRMYSSAVWLTHQGSKLSKSLFRLAKTSPMKAEGWTYLLCHTANCWGFDKALMDDKYKFADEKLDEWMLWANDPVSNRGWTKADDPFCFLAAILEIKRAMSHPGGPYEYRSGLVLAWDATCSGLQVLSSLGKSVDEGAFCNITTSEEVGDYYNAIAETVWKKCKYTEEEEKEYNKIVIRLRKFNKKLSGDLSKDKRKEVLNERRSYLKKKGKRIYELAKVFWAGKEDKKRKLCKRPCMTYFYSCREKTAAKQLKNDWASEPGFEDLNATFCFWLCVHIIKACEERMPTSTLLMNLMIDMGLDDYRRMHEYTYKGVGMSKTTIVKKLNEEYGEEGKKNEYTVGKFRHHAEEIKDIAPNEKFVRGGLDFSIVAPRTRFLFMQNYKSHKIEKVRVKYKKKTITLDVIIGKNDKLNYAKIKSATSPNFVHMLDAQISASILLDTNYNVCGIHDSFGAIPANAGKLFEDIRVVFVDLFDKELLEELMLSKGYEYDFKYGELNVKWIIDNDYAFS